MGAKVNVNGTIENHVISEHSVVLLETTEGPDEKQKECFGDPPHRKKNISWHL